jgi:hypothetical protein
LKRVLKNGQVPFQKAKRMKGFRTIISGYQWRSDSQSPVKFNEITKPLLTRDGRGQCNYIETQNTEHWQSWL